LAPKSGLQAALDHETLGDVGLGTKVATDGLLCPQVIPIAVRNHGVSDLKVNLASVVELDWHVLYDNGPAMGL
jgi:hypothetical protein